MNRMSLKIKFLICSKKKTFLNESAQILDFNITTGSFTIMAWINSPINSGAVFSKSRVCGFTYPPGYCYYLRGSDPWGRIVVNGESNTFNHQPTGSCNIDPADGTWHHITAIWDAPTYTTKSYIDGVLCASYTRGISNSISNDVSFMIGGRNNTSDVTGFIDEVAFFNESLNDSEIQQLFEITNNIL